MNGKRKKMRGRAFLRTKVDDQKKIVHFAHEHLLCRNHQVLLMDAKKLLGMAGFKRSQATNYR